MKTFSILILTLLPPLASAQQADSLAMLNLLKEDYKTLPAQDAARHRTLCTADFMLIENGEFMTMEREIEAFFKPNPSAPIVRTDSFSVKKVSVLGTTAYLAYVLRSDIRKGDQRKVKEWNESAVFRKEDGKWKIALVHSTPVEGK